MNEIHWLVRQGDVNESWYGVFAFEYLHNFKVCSNFWPMSCPDPDALYLDDRGLLLVVALWLGPQTTKPAHCCHGWSLSSRIDQFTPLRILPMYLVHAPFHL